MTSLKEVNATVKVGNKDIEELNKNFTKWFDSQKRNRLDDLENAREMKRAMKNSGVPGAAAVAGSGSANKDGFKFPKLLTGIAALLAALAAFKAFGSDFNPGDERPITPGLKPNRNLRTVKTGANARALAKIAKLNKIKIANINAELKAEQLKNKALADRVKADAKARAKADALQRKLNLRRNKFVPDNRAITVGDRANRSRFKNRFVPPRLTPFVNPVGPNQRGSFRNFSGLKGPGVLPFKGSGFNSNMQTVTSASGKIYPVNSPRGQQVINMTKTAADAKSLRNAANRNIKANIPPPPVQVKGQPKVIPKLTATQVVRARLMNTTKAVGNSNFASSVKGFSGKIMNMGSATGNWLRDKRDLMAYRQGAALPRWAQLSLRFAGWLAKKVVWAYIAYQWYYVMTDTTTSMQFKIVTSAGLLGSIFGFTVGAAVGAFLGTLAIPVPIVGGLIGGAIGGYLAGKGGHFIGEYIARKIMGIPQPERVVNDIIEFKARMARADAGHHGTMAMGVGETGSANAGGMNAFGFGTLSSGSSRVTSVAVRNRDLDGAAVRAGRTTGAGGPDLIGGLGRNLEGRANMTGIQYTEMRNRSLSEARLNALKSSSNGTTTFENMADTLKNQSGGGFFNQSDSNNDQSSTHVHNYGSNNLRTVDTLMAMNGHTGYGVMGLQVATAMGGFSSP